mmetsp:Transcript_144473/g.402478  ORF Transcript_144473/g.402478 Transcript_144473/m.402478 type:complete len:432 (-) Transcript_144473:80-1375(-)
MLLAGRATRTCRGHARRAAAVALVALGALLAPSLLRAFVGFRLPAPPAAPRALQQRCATVRLATQWDDPYLAQSADEDDDWDPSQSAFPIPQRESADRDVKVTDVRDLNELLKLPNPMKPTLQMQLQAVTLDDGTRIERPTLQDLKQLKPSELRPVTFTWRDKTRTQTRAPKQYDDIIQRLLNAGPADMEDLVRANWKMFDRAFFFRLTELKQDAGDERLREKISNLERLALDIVKAAQAQMRKTLPQHAEDSREIINSMLEGDRQTLLWPPPPEAFSRLAEAITLRATRAKYEDGWFESILEIVERYAKKQEVKQQTQLLGMGQVIMQRLVTEWLRHDGLWEETGEGQFIFRLMSLSHEQWPQQLFLEQAPLDANKLRDELKIISETKVMQLPMGSKLQVYAAKYLQGLVEFIEKKDDLLKQAGMPQASG